MKKLLLVFVVILVTTLCGCYKPNDINSLAYLLAIGIDKGEDDNNVYTLKFANPIVFAGKESGSEGDALKTVTVEANSVNNAFVSASADILKTVDTSYLKLILFSDKSDIKNTVDMMLKTSQFHPDTYVAMSKCSAAEFLKDINSPLEINPAKYYDNIFDNVYNEYSPSVSLKFAGDKFCVLPLVDKNSNSSQIAVLKDGKVISEGTKQEGKIYNIVSGNMKSFNYEVLNPESTLKLSMLSNVDIRTYFNETPEIELNFMLDGEIIENGHGYNTEEIAKAAKTQLENEIGMLLKHYYNETGCDIFGYKKLYKKMVLTNKEWEMFEKNFDASKTGFDVNVSITLKRDGIMLK